MTTREIPDQPEGDYRFMAIIVLDGYGRPRQLEKEFRQTLERLLHNELGKQARLTSLTRTAYDRQATAEAALCSDDRVGTTDSPDIDLVEE